MTKRIISLVLAVFMLLTVCFSLASCGSAKNDSIVGEWHSATGFNDEPLIKFYEDNTGAIRYQGSAFSDMTWEYSGNTVVINIAEYEDLHQKFDTLRIKQVHCKNGCLFGVMDDSQQTYLLEAFDSTSRADKFVRALQDNYESIKKFNGRPYISEKQAYKTFIDFYMKEILPLMD